MPAIWTSLNSIIRNETRSSLNLITFRTTAIKGGSRRCRGALSGKLLLMVCVNRFSIIRCVFNRILLYYKEILLNTCDVIEPTFFPGPGRSSAWPGTNLNRLYRLTKNLQQIDTRPESSILYIFSYRSIRDTSWGPWGRSSTRSLDATLNSFLRPR